MTRMMMRMSVPMPMYMERGSPPLGGSGPRYPARARSMRRDGPALGVDRPPLGLPADHPARHRPRVEARAAERLRGHERPPTHPAHEDQRPRGIQAPGLLAQLRHRDVARAGDPAGLPLVGLADVDDLGVAV